MAVSFSPSAQNQNKKATCVLHGTHLPPNKVLLRRQRHAAKVWCKLLDAWRHAFTRRGADKGDDHSNALPEHPPMYPAAVHVCQLCATRFEAFQRIRTPNLDRRLRQTVSLPRSVPGLV